MTTLPDLSKLKDSDRLSLADKIKTASDFQLPTLQYWNYSPCKNHETNTIGCRECGLIPRAHQKIGSAWLYFRKKALLADACGTGKSQSLLAKVLTPSGWKRMGELKLGELVIDPEGEISEITGIFPQGLKQSYLITFSDGTTATSCLDHLWKTRGQMGEEQRYLTRVGKDPRLRYTWSTVTLAQIKNDLDAGKLNRYGGIPLLRVPPDFSVGQNLPLDPYLCGALLGDGGLSGNGVKFTTDDPELIAEFEENLPKSAKISKIQNSKYDYYIAGLAPVVEKLGLKGKRSWEKFIPEEYKWTTAVNRLALLQGLMDTDGYCNPNGMSTEFSTTSRQLAEDVRDLCMSLGIKVGEIKERITSYTYKGEKRQGRISYRLFISETQDTRIFRLSRKLYARKETKSGRRWSQPIKWIRSIEPVGEPEEHQCISVSASSQLYVTDDWTVTHNTASTALMLAMAAEAGELEIGRVVVVCRAPAVRQWVSELNRMLPDLNTVAALGTTKNRIKIYSSDWNIVVVGREMFVKDYEGLENFDLAALLIDDVDSLRNRKNRVSWAIKRLAKSCPRVVVMNATPLHKRIQDLHSVLEPLGGRDIFGSETNFLRTYTRQERVTIYASGGRAVKTNKVTGYKNIGQFRELIEPMTLRRTIEDIDDVSLPAISPSTVWLDMHPAQQRKYQEIQAGVLKIIKSGKAQDMKMLQALEIFQKGAATCSGLAAVGDDDLPGVNSSKLDWVMEQITDGDFSDEKVVIFINTIKLVEAFQQRLENAGISQVTIWGKESNAAIRAERVEKFWSDPNCRILIGTSALESSLNLQVARRLIMVDTLLNPARMTQLAGRVQRDGSMYKTVYVYHLLTRDSQEESYLKKLEMENALADTIWNSRNELFAELSPLELLNLITN